MLVDEVGRVFVGQHQIRRNDLRDRPHGSDDARLWINKLFDRRDMLRPAAMLVEDNRSRYVGVNKSSEAAVQSIADRNFVESVLDIQTI